MYYAFYCEDAENSFEKRRSVREAHLANLQLLIDEDRVLVAGPLLNHSEHDTQMKGSLIIADFDNIEAAKAWIAADPYVTAEVFSRVTIERFKKVYPYD